MDLVGSVSNEVRVCKKTGGGKNIRSVFEGFSLCLCAFQGKIKKSGQRGGFSSFNVSP